MPAREAELARGFVLGEDDGIDESTVEDFRRAGLSHLLAVSGQNVALLGLLAMPLLAALGMPLRTRLLWVLAAIVVYVPLAGAGPSILRAGVMGGLSLLATLAGRRGSRLYGARGGGDPHPGDRSADRCRHRLAAQLRRRARHPCPSFAAARGDRGADRIAWLARRARRGRRDDDRRHSGDGAADRLPFRKRLDDDALRQPAGAACRGTGDVAGDACRARWPDPRLPGRGLQRDQRPAARLHRPGRRLVRPAELGLPGRAAERHRTARLLSAPCCSDDRGPLAPAPSPDRGRQAGIGAAKAVVRRRWRLRLRLWWPSS